MQTQKRRIANIILVLSVAVMIVSLAGYLWYVTKDYRTMRYWARVAASREKEPEDAAPNAVLPDYQALYEENHDLAGWLFVDEAHIDRPIMQTKSDPEYYLRRNFDKEDDWSGTPFADYRCSLSENRSFNTIIYGHNTVFRWLFEYAYKNRLYRTQRYINFDTLTQAGRYEVVAAFYADGSDAVLIENWEADDPQAYEWYNYIEIDSPEGFQIYKDRIRERKLYETDNDIELNDHIITIVCCASAPYSHIEEEGRLVIIAKQVE